MNIECVLNRPSHVDTSYGTGIWSFGQVKNIADDVARRMIRHNDVYVPFSGEVTGDIQNVTPEQAKSVEYEEKEMQLLDVATMSKAQLYDFITKNFNIRADLKVYKTEQSLRDYATQLFHQFGLPK